MKVPVPFYVFIESMVKGKPDFLRTGNPIRVKAAKKSVPLVAYVYGRLAEIRLGVANPVSSHL